MAATGAEPISAENLGCVTDELRGMLAQRDTLFCLSGTDKVSTPSEDVFVAVPPGSYEQLEVTCASLQDDGSYTYGTAVVAPQAGQSAEVMNGTLYLRDEDAVTLCFRYTADEYYSGVVRIVGIRSGWGRLLADLLALLGGER